MIQTDTENIIAKLGKFSAYKKVLLNKWDELPQIITSSAETKEGKEEILDFIEKTNTLFQL